MLARLVSRTQKVQAGCLFPKDSIPLSYVQNKICKRGCDVMLVLYGAVCDARVAEKQNGQGSKIQIMHVG